MKNQSPLLRTMIVRAIYDMTRDGIPVIEQERRVYDGPWGLCDAAADEAVMAKLNVALEKHFTKVGEVHKSIEEQIKTHGTIQEDLKGQIAKLNTDGGKVIGEIRELTEKQQTRILALEQKLIAGAAGQRQRPLTLGEQFIESKEWKDFAAAGSGMPGKRESKGFQFKTTYAPIGSQPASGGGGAFPEFLPTPVIPPFMPLTVRDLLDKGTTETNLIEWVQENVFTNNAAIVSEGATKPQSNITYDRLMVPVMTVAHWITASKQILADFKQLATLINGRLSFGLKQAEETQLLYGDGISQLNGLIPNATAYNTALSKPDDTRIDIIRHAMLQVQLAFYPTTGITMSPVDWHGIELTKDKFGRYLLTSAAGSAPAMLWGVPVVQGYSMAVGDFLVGAFALAATIFDREQSQILVSTETGTNFIQNLVTILCEERLALAITRPKAFIFGAFPSGSSDTA